MRKEYTSPKTTLYGKIRYHIYFCIAQWRSASTSLTVATDTTYK